MSPNAARTIFRFGDFELDMGAYELRRKGRRLRLARQPMDLWLLLLERPRELISREEIAKRLWAHAPDVRSETERVRQDLENDVEHANVEILIPGLEFLTKLPVEDKRALIAFLRSI